MVPRFLSLECLVAETELFIILIYIDVGILDKINDQFDLYSVFAYFAIVI